ncbi:hypothetical protein J6590_101480 [Homalodisca vitripennis]|nr:hypothetical protein J6590_101480 [Homalodisca vitripennis]
MSVKGKKQVGKLSTAERGRNVTLLLSINTAGDMFIAPLFVFQRVRMDIELSKDAPLGRVFDAQPSGWITTYHYRDSSGLGGRAGLHWQCQHEIARLATFIVIAAASLFF